jgi:acyl-CoA synthetase (AMP-forming)/AMP-acid ligase II
MAPIEDARHSVPSALARWARDRPEDPAFTFVDYEADPAGIRETLSWSQIHRRAGNVAKELAGCGSQGDRAVIVAPQGLDYIAAFLGALEAGWIAVPLSVPQQGDHDERIRSVLADSTPSAVLVTSAAVNRVRPYLRGDTCRAELIAIDALDLDGPDRSISCPTHPKTAYLQYTSGSTREPTGVVISHHNLAANFHQTMQAYYGDTEGVPPSDTTMVSWLPLFHDMGMFVGVCGPILGGLHAELMSPMSFLIRPARWLQMMAGNTRVFTSAPNFAFALAARRVADKDMAGIDLADVSRVINGSERVDAATLAQFAERFAPFNLRAEAVRPSYGLAEATVFVAARALEAPPATVTFDAEKLSAGVAEPSAAGGPRLVSYGVPRSPAVRIVDPDRSTEKPAGGIGEIWVFGGNVAAGYWRKPAETKYTFGAKLLDPSPGTPEGPWLRTGDLGAFSEGELFVVGRIKDLVIVDGRNHYPDDIEATVREITGGRVAAISYPSGDGEKLAVISEYMFNGETEEELPEKVSAMKGAVTRTVSTVHGIRVADLVVVEPGSIPYTTSGKVQRRACADQYVRSQFRRIG